MSTKPIIKDGELRQEHTIGAKTTIVGVTAMAALIALGIAGYLAGQKRAALEDEDLQAAGNKPSANAVAGPSTRVAVAGDASPAGLTSAVGEALKTADNDRNSAMAPLQTSAADDSELTRKQLDELAKNRVALEAYNRNITNKVSESTAQERDNKRLEIESAVIQAGDAARALPAKEAQALKEEASREFAEGRTVEVRAGDSLWTLAKRVYGDPYQYRRIFEANPLLLKSPDHIYPGQVLRAPK